MRQVDGEYRHFLIRQVPLRDDFEQHREMVWGGHRYRGPEAGGGITSGARPGCPSNDDGRAAPFRQARLSQHSACRPRIEMSDFQPPDLARIHPAMTARDDWPRANAPDIHNIARRRP